MAAARALLPDSPHNVPIRGEEALHYKESAQQGEQGDKLTHCVKGVQGLPALLLYPLSLPHKGTSLLKKSPMDEYTVQLPCHLRSDFVRQG
jgi:hypothetical protein